MSDEPVNLTDTTVVAGRLASRILTRPAPAPIRYATVISTSPLAGTAVVRPSNATATDGSQDLTANLMSPTLPQVGAVVRIDVNQGDVLVLGTVGPDTFKAWGAFTPTIGGTGWALGNGTAFGSWAMLGRTLEWEFNITFGSTSTFGAGGLTIAGLPVNKSSLSIPFLASAIHLGSVYALLATINGTTNIFTMQTFGSPGALVTSTVPFTWASGDLIRCGGSMQVG